MVGYIKEELHSKNQALDELIRSHSQKYFNRMASAVKTYLSQVPASEQMNLMDKAGLSP